MRRITLLITATLLASSCSLRPTPPQTVIPSSGQQSPVAQNHKQLSPEELAEISNRLGKLAQERKSSEYLSQSVRPKYSYKGLPGHRHIDNYSDEELKASNQDELTVVVDDRRQLGATAERFRQLGMKVGRAHFDTITLKIPESGVAGLRKYFKLLDNQSNVKIVSPRRGYEVQGNRSGNRFSLQYTPNDPILGSQWGLDKINAKAAWNYYSIRSAFGIIAVLSSGVNKNHEDLKNRLMLGYNTTPTWSYPFTTTSVDDYNYDTTDTWGQGTFLSGVAAAQFNNGIGISGSAGGAHIMPMVVTEYSYSPYSETMGYGHRAYGDNARYAAKLAIEAGAKVLLCPFNVVDDWFFHDMVRIAEEAGVPVIAPRATSRDTYGSYENPFPGNWPADYSNSNVINVTSINQNDQSDDGYGNGYSYVRPSAYADFAAPGTGIYGTKLDGGYGSSSALYSGTHVAAALVAGAYSSLGNACRALPLWQITDVFAATATDLGSPGWDQNYGHGLLNFGAAANYLLGSGLVYRWVDVGSNLHDWSTNPALSLGNLYEGVRFAIKPTQVPGTVPLYRKVPTGAKNDVLLTTDANEAYHLGYQINDGNNNATPIGYISLTYGAAPGMTKALYRLWKAGEGHFYTTDSAERDRCTNLWGWTYEGITGYTW